MIDRFGLLPEQVKNLFSQAMIRVKAQRLGIAEIEASHDGGSIAFTDQTQVAPLTLVKLIQGNPKMFSLSGSNKLRFSTELPDLAERQDFLEQLLVTLEQDPT